ncbi:TPA: hypothetical protein R8J12_001791, partial [Campylobacter jejuni]|nr:hypothetical protein [Campylobacter jejuni]
GNIQTLINSGTIISNNYSSNNAGIKLENNGSIENIINTGTIESNYSGIMVTYGKFGTLTIKDGGKVHGKYIGIGVGQWQALGDLYIDGENTSNNGTVSGVYGDSYGISLDRGSRTQKIELKNGGVIKGNNSGIRLDSGASLNGEMILSGEGSRVEGGRGGAGIFNFDGKIQGSITVKEGATVTATSNQAISNVGSGSITGGITVSGKNTKLKGNIINADNASIGSNIKIENGAKVEGGLVNQGSGSILGNVQVSGGSTINSITNTGSGAISGSVQVSDGSTIDSITNTGNGAISGSITVDKNSKLDSITNEGNGAISGSVQVSGGSTIDSITNTGDGAISGSITVDKNSKLDSITNEGNGAISGSVQVSGGSTIDSITNTGNGAISGSITVDKNSKLDSITNTSSTGIKGSITNNSDNKLEISNSGNIGGKIESTGAADMVISNSNGGTISG